MELGAIDALRGYGQGRSATAADPAASGQSFHETLAGLARRFEQTMASGETASLAAMTGSGSSQSLVTALAQSQLALETAVAVRNKVVEAYQELLRIPV